MDNCKLYAFVMYQIKAEFIYLNLYYYDIHYMNRLVAGTDAI